MKIKFSIFILFSLLSFSGISQLTVKLEREIDSLKKVLAKTTIDSVKINCLSDWDNLIFSIDSELDFKLNNRIKKICEANLKNKLNKIEHKFYSIKLANCLNNLGNVFDNRGDLAKSIDCYSRSLKIYEKYSDKDGMAHSFNSIGNLYSNQKDNEKAILNYTKSLKLREEIKDQQGLAMTLNNIGSIYHNMGDDDKAIEYSERSLKIREEIGNKRGASISLNNIGSIYAFRGNYKKASEYYLRSLTLKQEVGDKMGTAICYLNIGGNYSMMGDYTLGITYYKHALEIAQELDMSISIIDASDNLCASYKKKGMYKEALEMFELYTVTKDSVDREEGKKELVRQEFKYAYEKKATADSVRQLNEKKLSAAKLSQEKTQRYALYLGLFLTIVFGVFMFSRFRITSKQKEIIEKQKGIVEEQKELVEEKQREVMDSIHYAKRIQEALLPSNKYIEKSIKKLKEK